MTLRNLQWRIPLVAAVTAICLWVSHPPFDPDGSGPAAGKLKLGLDLQGGMHLVLRVKTETLPVADRKDAMDRALEIIRNRIDQFGVAEPSIQRQGENEIVVELPGISDRDRALNLIGKTALLEFKLVSESPASDPAALPAGTKLYKDEQGKDLLLEEKTLLEGKNLTDASRQTGGDWNEPVVSLTLDSDGAKKFADITTKYVNRRLAILLDDVVQSAPNIREPILTGEAQISGSFTIQEAHDLSIALRAGALPAPIEIEEERTVGASLGQDSVKQGLHAMLVSSVIVMIFMLVYYLVCGAAANIALVLNIVMTVACLAYFKATLTMPGIAGIILTIGMAVDTNVLIFERIREELKLGKAVKTAVDTGYRRAFSAVIDTHITTLITALIFYNMGTGPVRGYAVTLMIGILSSLFTGIFVSRILTDVYVALRKPTTLRMLGFLRTVPKIDFLKPRGVFYVLSSLLVGGLLFVTVARIDKQYGVDFKGGVLQEVKFQAPVSVDEVRSALKEVGLESAVIQQVGADSRSIIIRAGLGTKDKVDSALKTAFTSNSHEAIRIETVGPVVGKALRKKAGWAIAFSIIAILAYLAFRFEVRYSVAAVVALFHDATICLGAVVFTGREVSIPVLAAILTIVGYSVNDTIVSFDRVRENLKKLKLPYAQIVNMSINETLARTILTSLTVLMVVVALFLFGGPVINDFAFTMLVGLISGTYSTIFIACPMVVDWPGRKHK